MNTKALKALTVTVSLIAALGAATEASAAVPALEVEGKPAFQKCDPLATTGNINHSDKIVFMIGDNGNLQPLVAADFAALNALPKLTELDIKIRDNPARVADIKAKLLFFLGAANTLANRALIRITDVEYAIAVCPKAP